MELPIETGVAPTAMLSVPSRRRGLYGRQAIQRAPSRFIRQPPHASIHTSFH